MPGPSCVSTALSLPAGVAIVDVAADILGERTHRVRIAEDDKLPIDQRLTAIKPALQKKYRLGTVAAA